MGKREKVPAENVGRVPLVQGGKPLLYPRYNSIDELLQIGKGAGNGDAADGAAGEAGERPSKKQKRAAAATAAADGATDGEQAAATASAGKGYGVVGEDGLTYKQRRQLRRAEERAAKAEAAAAAGGAGSDAAEPPLAGDGLPPPADGAPKSDKKDKKKKKEKGGGEEQGDGAGPAAAEAAAPAAARGNVDEAARMRAVLGFTSAAGAASGAAMAAATFAAATAAAATAAAATAAAATASPTVAGAGPTTPEPDADAAGRSGKKQKDKKDKKADKKRASGQEAGDGDEGAAAAEGAGAAAEGGAQRQPEASADAGGAAAAAASVGKAGGKAAIVKRGAGSSQFSFDFKVQAEVEAETEARLARLMALDSTKDGFVPRRVWVSGLPHEFHEETIREYWGYCGEVESMHLLTFPDSGNFNGTAFITFKTQAGYEAALACHGEMLEGRALRVEKCKAAAEMKGKERLSGATAAAANGGAGKAATAVGGASPAAGRAGRAPGYPVAYVGNIAFEAGVEELQALFKGAGAVPTKVRLHSDKATGRSKGYAHVHFGSDEDVDRAVTLDGTTFHSRKIRVSYAQPKPGEVA